MKKLIEHHFLTLVFKTEDYLFQMFVVGTFVVHDTLPSQPKAVSCFANSLISSENFSHLGF